MVLADQQFIDSQRKGDCLWVARIGALFSQGNQYSRHMAEKMAR